VISDAQPQSLFEQDGLVVHPTAAALGPWRHDALHGGAVSALLSHGLEENGWVLARVTVDLMRRVPLQELRLAPGRQENTRRMLRKQIELWAGDQLVAKAEALLLPETRIDLPPQPERSLAMPEDLERQATEAVRVSIAEQIGFTSFVSHAVATYRSRLGEAHPGSSVYWIKLLLPLIAGEDITPVQRVTIAADYANGGFVNLPFEQWSFVSLDLTVQLTRPPVGEWVAVTNDSLAESTGIGLGDAELYDANGRIGRSVATLLVEPR
jgi:Thioesterase-like superfamily